MFSKLLMMQNTTEGIRGDATANQALNVPPQVNKQFGGIITYGVNQLSFVQKMFVFYMFVL